MNMGLGPMMRAPTAVAVASVSFTLKSAVGLASSQRIATRDTLGIISFKSPTRFMQALPECIPLGCARGPRAGVEGTNPGRAAPRQPAARQGRSLRGSKETRADPSTLLLLAASSREGRGGAASGTTLHHYDRRLHRASGARRAAWRSV